MPSCPACGQMFADGERFCPADGSKLPIDAEPRTTDDPLLGKIVDGRYRIESKIGEGGMGTVYRAVHVHMDKRFALKILRPQLAVDATAVKRFQREAKSASLLDHEHCIRVSDFGSTADGLLYLAMEHLEGRTLGDELHQVGALAPRRAAAIALETAQALAHAHELGLVHRDLKPDNVFLLRRPGNNDFVKVLDFGLAKLLEREDVGGRTSLTEHGVVFGTPEYMSPEQAEGHPLDAQTDVYSLGICLYHMLTGQLPFQAPTYMGILTKHIVEPPVSPAEKRPDLGLPPSLVGVIMRCLEKAPAQRPAGAREVAELLSRCDLASAPAAPARVPSAIAAHPTIDVVLPSGGLPLPSWPMGSPMDSPMGSPMDSPMDSIEATTPVRSRRVLAIVVTVMILAAVALGASALLRTRGVQPPVTTAPPPAADAAVVASLPAKPAEELDAAPLLLDAAASSSPPRPKDPPRETAADHLSKAAMFRKRGDRIQERVQLQKALEIDRENPEAHFLLGEGALADGNHDLACRHLKRASGLKKAKILYEKAECDLVAP